MKRTMDFVRARRHLKEFLFQDMFIEDLGWHNPEAGGVPLQLPATATGAWTGKVIAQLEGFAVIEVESDNGSLPTAKDERKLIHSKVGKNHHEHLLIFTDQQKEKCLWSWMKDRRKNVLRDQYYFRGQTGDLFLSKLASVFFELKDLDGEGNVRKGIVEVVERVTNALDVESVTRKFFGEYTGLRKKVIMAAIKGIENDADKQKYASLLLNRLMFIWFLQKKGFVGNQDADYLQTKYDEIAGKGNGDYYRDFLQPLFFEGLAKPEEKRSSAVNRQIGEVPYMNGGLFTHSAVERNNDISVDNKALGEFLGLLGKYQWHLDDTPGGADNTINPKVLGYIFEKQINDKKFGAYYTRPEITGYLCERTIHQAIYDRLAPSLGKAEARKHESLNDVLANLTVPAGRKLIEDILPNLSILDPACGSGAFLIEAVKTVADVYFAVIDVLEADDREFLAKALPDHQSEYAIRKRVVTKNIYGVDIMGEAVEICRLRLFLALISTITDKKELEPLPNIDFNIMSGNSLIGLQRISEDDIKKEEQPDLLVEGYSDILKKYSATKKDYQNADNSEKSLEAMKKELENLRSKTYGQLNVVLMRKLHEKNICYEQQTWDEATKSGLGKGKKDPLTEEHVSKLNPFHWGFEFDEILNQRGGFDVIIANPPWEAFKPNAKEFFLKHSSAVSKKSMTVKDFDEKKKEMLAGDPQLRTEWLVYLSDFPHQSNWFRKSGVYKHQSAMVMDFKTGKEKKTGTDINLYKLFVEKSHSLLADGGQCGIVVPSGIYTDSGAKGLRKMLFAKSRISGMFCFENRKRVFEEVDSRVKFVVLTFTKGGRTEDFPAEFMRHDVQELEFFPNPSSNRIEVGNSALVSPETLAITEIKSGSDLSIIKKMLRSPLLGDKLPGTWSVQFKSEFHMTNDSNLFRQARELGESGFVRDGETWVKGREKYLPLYEGKMIHQFTHKLARSEVLPKYWIREEEGRQRYENRPGQSETLAYQIPQLAFRNVARSTDERSMIMSFLPAEVFASHSIGYAYIRGCENQVEFLRNQLWLCAFANSFAFDYMLRMKISAYLSFIVLYQIPVPPPPIPDNEIADRILARAAQLVYADGQKQFSHIADLGFDLKESLNDVQRTYVCAEIDALVAHLYGLDEQEYAYILDSFPLVSDRITIACQNAYRDFTHGLLK